MAKILLKNIAYARSGDKGANANIGVIAYDQQGYNILKECLTTERVSDYFQKYHPKSVTRYELPNLLAFNFVLEGILEEGGSLSLRTDAQGKALGQIILEMDLDVPSTVTKSVASN